jgi:hypothetical protein
MEHIPTTIFIEPGTDLDRALDEAGDNPVEFERRGIRYRVVRVLATVDNDDIWKGYAPERTVETLSAIAGGWVGLVDAEEFKAYIAERRRTANRPSRAR